MPASTTRVKPSDRTSWANARSSSTRSAMVSGRSSQPRRSLISVGLGFQTVWSRRHTLPTRSSRSAASRRWSTRSSSGRGPRSVCRLRGGMSAASLASIAASSLSKSASNPARPSSSSRAVT